MTAEAHDYPVPGADVPGAPPALHRDRADAKPVSHARTVRSRSAALAVGVALLAGAVAVALACRRAPPPRRVCE